MWYDILQVQFMKFPIKPDISSSKTIRLKKKNTFYSFHCQDFPLFVIAS